jgi:RNA-binding protein YhbY
VHNFLEQVVANVRGQAGFLANMLAKQNEVNTWKAQAEEQIRVVQLAGNTLADKVQSMGETAVLVRLEQEDKNVAMKDIWKQLDSDIT